MTRNMKSKDGEVYPPPFLSALRAALAQKWGPPCGATWPQERR